MGVPKRVAERLQSGLKRYRPVLEAQKARDVSEADTVTLVKDMLSDLFGYDKYVELTSEHSIRGTFCDLAVKLENKLAFLIEVKAIGLELKDMHVKQAVDYASNQGCEWVVLTNALDWRLYHVLFKKPIDKQEIAHINLQAADLRSDDDLERLFLLTREGFTRSALAEYRDKKDATSRFMLAALLMHSEAIQYAIRREIRRVSEIMVDAETVTAMLRDQVIKREALEGEQAETAARRVTKSGDKAIKRSTPKQATAEDDGAPVPVEAEPTA